MSSATLPRPTFVHLIGETVLETVRLLGDVTLFGLRMVRWLNWPRGGVIWPLMYQIGVQSLPVILITGGFIGMVLAVQAYDQFALMGMENQLGTVINVTLVKEAWTVPASYPYEGGEVVPMMAGAEIGWRVRG